MRPIGLPHITVRPVVLAGPAVVLSLFLGACGSDGDSSSSAASAAASSATGTTPSASGTDSAPSEEPLDVVEGMFDVGGHDLYLRCEGSGSPTVIYLHGSIQDSSVIAHSNGAGFQQLLSTDYRTCVYDRRNVGNSDTVDAIQLPQDALADMRRLLGAADIAPPYVLVGASFGGMLSYLYANEHPDEVVGMVLLDAMFPDELSLEYLFPPEETYEAYSEDDENHGLERISHFKVITAGQRFIGKEPAIPVTYLASTQEGYEDNDYGIPEYNRKILEIQAAYVDRFSPGRRIEVDTPHFMEPVIPEQIADEVRRVIELAAG